MTFFQIDPALYDTISIGSEPIRIRIIISFESAEDIPLEHDSIESAYFISEQAQSGIVTSRAEITFTSENDIHTSADITEAKLFFSCGNNSAYLHRFTMYPDDSNMQSINSGGSKAKYRIMLEDIPARLKRTGAAKDWSTPQVVIDATISDKERPETSILHLIASKAGIEPADTESCIIPHTIPYAVIDRDAWNDLTDFVNTFKAIIEGGTEKKLILSDSRYQRDYSIDEEIPELTEDLFYRVDEQNAGDLLKNDIRLRWNKPERQAHQTIWKYNEPPVNYDSNLSPSYPFSYTGEKRRIEQEPPAEAPYTANIDGELLTTVYADEIDNQASVEARMQNVTGGVSIESYDTTTHEDRALVKLSCNADDEIKNLSIEGRPTVIRQNCSCYLHDEESITENGLRVLNVTGRYFLDADCGDLPHFQDWTEDTLSKLKNKRRRYTLYTQYCIFFIRTGAKTYFNRLNDERPLCRITSLEMTYNKTDGFEVKTILEEE